MASKLFEYAVLYHPKPRKDANQNEVEEPSEILVKPEIKLAKSDKEIAMLAARAIPEKYIDKLEQVEIIVRPFN